MDDFGAELLNTYAPESNDIPLQDEPRAEAPRKAAPRRKDSSPEGRERHKRPKPSEQSAPRHQRSSEGKSILADKRMKMFLGLVMVLISLLLAIFMVSHFKNGGHDQSSVMNGGVTSDTIGNVGGPVGAKVSYMFVTQWFGLGSIAFIIYIAVIGLSLLGIRKTKFWATTFQALLIGITTSIVLGLLTYTWSTDLSWGGEHGRFVNRFMLEHMGVPGAVALSILLLGTIVIVYFNQIYAFYKARKIELDARRRRRQAARAEFEAQKRAAEEALASAKSNLTEQELPVIPDDGLQINDSAESPIEDSAEQKETKPEAAVIEEKPIPAAVETDAEEHNDTMKLQELEEMSVEEPSSPSGISERDEVLNNEPEKPADNSSEDFSFSFQIDEKEENAIPSASESEESHSPEPKRLTASPVYIDIDDKNTEKELESVANTPISVKVNQIEMAEHVEKQYDPTDELSRYCPPPLDLLAERENTAVNVDIEEQEANKQRIIKTLLEYKIPISKIDATIGPTITLFEIVPAEGVKISSIRQREDDIARSLAAEGIRIIAPIPGRGTVGIEVPNHVKQTVSMRSVLASKRFQETKCILPMAMGTNISNEVFIADLAKMPHLLVAGATGQGKSVGLNAIIASLIYKRHPAELKFVLVDPKMVEFSLYNKLERHFLAKIEGEEDAIITDPEKVKATLNSLCVEMDNRYMLLKDAYVRSLEEYNEKFINRRLNPEKGHRFMPYIVVVVDEFADLIMMAGKEIELPIARIAQKARAVGIHLIIATQRPSTNVITGMIKANFPGRIAFRVAASVDSKTILDRTGANQLIGKGDMLFSWNSNLERVQCAFISTEEVEAICDWIDNQVGYDSAYYLPEYVPEGGESVKGNNFGDRDSLFDEAARFVVSSNTASTSSLQRRYSIGYNRAGKIMDQLEAAGIVGASNGGKPRAILVDGYMLEKIIGEN